MTLTPLVAVFQALALWTMAPCPVVEKPLAVSAIAFNIRYGTASDGANAWTHRQEAVLAYIQDSKADFIGLQEVLAFQLKQIKDATDETYDLIVRSREARDGVGEATPLLYKKDRWRLDAEHTGTFWLSETPEEPGSKSWDSSLPRIVTWGRFIERASDQDVWVFNTHFDHRSEAARRESAKLIAQRIGDVVPSGAPVIVLGDLNAREQSVALQVLKSGAGKDPVVLVDSWRLVHPNSPENCTFNGWGEGIKGRKIDYVLVPVGTTVRSAQIHRKRIEGRPISDHWPVEAEVVFETKKE